jgi:hypothetical protein
MTQKYEQRVRIGQKVFANLSSTFECETSVCTEGCGTVMSWLSSMLYIACPQTAPICRRLVTKIM